MPGGKAPLRNCDFLRLWRAIYKMNMVHLVLSEHKEMLKRNTLLTHTTYTQMMGVCQRHTGASYKTSNG